MKAVFCKSVIIYAFHQTPTRSVRMERILFNKKTPAEIWRNMEKHQIRNQGNSPKVFGSQHVDQTHVIII